MITLAGAASALALPPELARQASGLQARPAAEAFLQLSEEKHASSEFVAQVLSEAKTLEAQGIAAEPYLQKANEGLAKGFSPAQISPALRQTEERGIVSAQLVNRTLRQSEERPSLASRQEANLRFQQALLNQVSRQSLEGLIDASGAKGHPRVTLEQISTAAAVIPRLQKFNLGEKEASQRVREALQGGASTRSLIEMSRDPKRANAPVEKNQPKVLSPLENQRGKALKPHGKDPIHIWQPGPPFKEKGKPFSQGKPANPGLGRGKK